MIFLFLLLATSLGQDCEETREVYPKVTAKAMSDVTGMKDSFCDMFTFSCCTFVTEYKMKVAADKWGSVVTASYDSALQILQMRSLYPELIPNSVVASVKASVDYSLPLNTATLTKVALAASGVICDENSSEYGIVKQYIQPSVATIADTLTALAKGLKSLKKAYNVIRAYNFSTECKRVIIRSGVPTRENMQSNNCQVCTSGTIAYNTCKNTCKMAVSGCYNELAGVHELIPLLLNTLDGIYTSLQKQLKDQYLNDLMFMASTYPQCFGAQDKGNDPDVGQVDRSYYSRTLNLGKISLENGINYACSDSESNTNCWTSSGVTASDSTPKMGFTTSEQARNLLLPLVEAAVPEEVKQVELSLRSQISSYADQSDPEENTPAPSSTPDKTTLTTDTPTPTLSNEVADPNEEEVKDGGGRSGGSGVWRSWVGVVVGVVVWYWQH